MQKPAYEPKAEAKQPPRQISAQLNRSAARWTRTGTLFLYETIDMNR